MKISRSTVACQLHYCDIIHDVCYSAVTAIITRTPESIQSNPVVVREGQAVQISFNVVAYPQPSGFTWSRDGAEISSGNGLILALDSFTANPTNKEDRGTYVLAVTNTAGLGYYNFTLDIQCKACINVYCRQFFIATCIGYRLIEVEVSVQFTRPRAEGPRLCKLHRTCRIMDLYCGPCGHNSASLQ